MATRNGFYVPDPRNLLPPEQAVGAYWRKVGGLVGTPASGGVGPIDSTTNLTQGIWSPYQLDDGVRAVPGVEYAARVRTITPTVNGGGSMAWSLTMSTYDRATGALLIESNQSASSYTTVGVSHTVPASAQDPYIVVRVTVSDPFGMRILHAAVAPMTNAEMAAAFPLIPSFIETNDWKDSFDVRIALYYPGGGRYKTLTAAENIQATFPFCDHGALSFEYNKLLRDAAFMDTDFVEVALEYSVNDSVWKEAPGGRFVRLTGSTDDMRAEDNLTLNFVSYSWLMHKMTMSGGNYTLTEAGTRRFVNVTPGYLLKVIIDEGRNNGVFSALKYSFTATEDSQGVAWNQNVTIEFQPGTDLHSIVQALVEGGYINWTFYGNSFYVTNESTGLRWDASAQVNYRFGYEIKAAPRSRSIEGFASRAVVFGDDRSRVVVDRPSAATPWGKFDIALSQAGVENEPILSALANAELDKASYLNESLTRELTLSRAKWFPWVHWYVGAFISTSTINGAGEVIPRKDRIRQLGIMKNANSGITAALVLNSLQQENEVRLIRRISKMTSGVGLSGGAAGSSPSDKPSVPKAPTGLTVTTDVYFVGNGYRALAVAAWQPVTQNVKNQDIAVNVYEVWGKRSTEDDFRRLSASGNLTMVLDNRSVGETWSFKVRAINAVGAKPSAFSNVITVKLAEDTTAPPVPVAPILTSRGGTVAARWNGTYAQGTQPADFNSVELAYSTAGYTDFNNLPGSPVPLVLVSRLFKPGSIAVAGLAYNTTPTFAFRSSDNAGNVSAWSVTSSVTINPLISTDFLGKIVSGANLIDYSVDGTLALAAGSIDTTRLRVGQASLVLDGLFNNPQINAYRSGAGLTGAGTGTLTPQASDGTPGYVNIVGSTAGETRFDLSSSSEKNPMPVTPGVKYQWQHTITNVSGTANCGLRLAVKLADGTVTNVTLNTASVSGTYAGEWIAPANAVSVGMLMVQAAGTATYRHSNLSFRQKIAGVLIEDGAVTAERLAANSVVAGKIASNVIVADNLTAGSVTGIKISADAIDGKVITGATIQTSAALNAARLVIDSSGIRQRDANQNIVSEWTPSAFTVQNGTIMGGTVIGGSVTGSLIRTAASDVYPRMEIVSSGRINLYTDLDSTDPGGMRVYNPGSANYRAVRVQGPMYTAGTFGFLDLFGHTGNVGYEFQLTDSNNKNTISGATDTGVVITSTLNSNTSKTTWRPNGFLDLDARQINLITGGGGAAGGTMTMDINGLTNINNLVITNDSNPKIYRVANAQTNIVFGGGEISHAATNAHTFKIGANNQTSFQVGAISLSYGTLAFRDYGGTYIGNDYGMGLASSSRLDIGVPDGGTFVIAKGGRAGTAMFVVRGGGSGDVQFEFQNLVAATGTANLYVINGSTNQLRKTSSLRKDKIDARPLGIHYEILDIIPQTWLDRQTMLEDRTNTIRIGGAIAEDVLAVSNTTPNKDLHTMLVWDEQRQLVSIAYDRAFFHFLPVAKDMNRRLTEAEETVVSQARAIKVLEDQMRKVLSALKIS